MCRHWAAATTGVQAMGFVRAGIGVFAVAALVFLIVGIGVFLVAALVFCGSQDWGLPSSMRRRHCFFFLGEKISIITIFGILVIALTTYFVKKD